VQKHDIQNNKHSWYLKDNKLGHTHTHTHTHVQEDDIRNNRYSSDRGVPN